MCLLLKLHNRFGLNIGNTSRRAFADPEAFSQIVNLDVDLVRDMATLLDAINCGFELSPEAFQARADDWLDRWHASNMSWNVLSPYAVKIIMNHVTKLINHARARHCRKHLGQRKGLNISTTVGLFCTNLAKIFLVL